MREEKIPPVEFQKERWENLQAEKPYSENFSHLLHDHENIWYWCYQTEKQAGYEFITDLEFFICWN